LLGEYIKQVQVIADWFADVDEPTATLEAEQA
jgi:hypothetical protein